METKKTKSQYNIDVDGRDFNPGKVSINELPSFSKGITEELQFRNCKR